MKKFNLWNSFDDIKKISDKKYDAIIIGSGFSGSVHANRLFEEGYDCLVIEKRDHIGGNCYTYKNGNIDVHKYGSHIFHTNSDSVWEYINQFTDFNDYKHSLMASTGEEMVMLPFTMVTFNQLFNTKTVNEVKEIINLEYSNYCKENGLDYHDTPKNFEVQAIKIAGTTIYEKLIKHYTEKQWGRSCKDLPAEIIKRLPLRFNTDTTYFNNAKYQGIPVDGYTEIFKMMLDGIDVLNHDLNIEDLKMLIENNLNKNGKIIFTGALDRLFKYELGALEYRSLRFFNEDLKNENYQGAACLNFTDSKTNYTRITEHKHYSKKLDALYQQNTIITYEFPEEFDKDNPKTEEYYPIGDQKNKDLWKEYEKLAKETFGENFILSGRLATYQYLDMDKTIELALISSQKIIEEFK